MKKQWLSLYIYAFVLLVYPCWAEDTPAGFSFSGIVVDATPSYSGRVMQHLGESPEAEPDGEIYAELFPWIPMPDVLISLQNDAFDFKTVADKAGHFTFSGIPVGEYTLHLVAAGSKPQDTHNLTTDKRKKYFPTAVRADGTLKTIYIENTEVTWPVALLHRSDWVTISGRVIDGNNKPLTGIKVYGKSKPWGAKQDWNIVHTLTDVQGKYQLYGFDPALPYPHGLRYLTGAAPDQGQEEFYDDFFYVTLQVDLSDTGYLPVDELKIPMVTEACLQAAKVLKNTIIAGMSKYKHDPELTWWLAREHYSPPDLPKSDGNIIFVDDIILGKLEDAAPIME